MSEIKKYILYTIVVLTWLLSPVALTDTRVLKFTQTLYGQEFLCAHKSLRKVYAKLGYEIIFQTLPNKRALEKSNSGNVDGEMLRIEGIEVNYPNLIRIPIPICSIISKTIAKEYVNATTYEELRKFKLGITFGFIGEEILVKKYKLNAYSAIGTKSLIKMFKKNHLDVIFLSENDADNLLNIPKEKGYKQLDELNRDIFLYHYIHVKNKELVPLVTDELRKLEKQGLMNTRLRRPP